jgi:hypothetical protein
MEYLVGRIQATNYLYFIEDKLEIRGHNKPLYITVRCRDCTVDKEVLVDSGSTLNILLKHVWMKCQLIQPTSCQVL